MRIKSQQLIDLLNKHWSRTCQTLHENHWFQYNSYFINTLYHINCSSTFTTHSSPFSLKQYKLRLSLFKNRDFMRLSSAFLHEQIGPYRLSIRTMQFLWVVRMSLLLWGEHRRVVVCLGKSMLVVILISFSFCGGLRSITVINPFSDMQYKYPWFYMIFLYKDGDLTKCNLFNYIYPSTR